ncbi:hypothetical protein PoB_003791000 [Plakobranchus ocellatus]|uniref:Uncharacterized protein n=1 Tax=Plakobranchus ocellatus TaxID=259542 RepID=A0AAV4AVW7_9GAST|nr:hypothetical protein PoB_003791000 [Plakobranchus ocellatus]
MLSAILLLLTPSPCAGGPCDCASCQTYSTQKQRCFCCVYHGAGGKRSLSDSSIFLSRPARLSPSLHFLLTSDLLEPGTRASFGQEDENPHGDQGVSRRWMGAKKPQTESYQHGGLEDEADFLLDQSLPIPTHGQRDARRTARAVETWRRMLGAAAK